MCENSAIVRWFERSLALPFFGIGMKTDLFQFMWPLQLHGAGMSGGEKIPHVQGQEQQLLLAGMGVKRYPTSKVRETSVRW